MTKSTMTVSKALRSIKSTPDVWTIRYRCSKYIVVTNGEGYFFTKYMDNRGTRLINLVTRVDMRYAKDDVIGQQLWESVRSSLRKRYL